MELSLQEICDVGLKSGQPSLRPEVHVLSMSNLTLVDAHLNISLYEMTCRQKKVKQCIKVDTSIITISIMIFMNKDV